MVFPITNTATANHEYIHFFKTISTQCNAEEERKVTGRLIVGDSNYLSAAVAVGLPEASKLHYIHMYTASSDQKARNNLVRERAISEDDGSFSTQKTYIKQYTCRQQRLFGRAKGVDLVNVVEDNKLLGSFRAISAPF